MKKCTKCGVEKPEDSDHFYKHPDGKNGLNPQCKECHGAQTLKWKKKNPSNVKRITRRGHLKQYGLTETSYEAILFSQNNKCAICARMLSCVGVQTDVDHCHTTGKVRGILCNLCNSALGKFQNSEEVLFAAIEYLRKHK